MKNLPAVIFSLVLFTSADAAQLHDEIGSAIDAKGIRYVVRSEYGMPPWFAEMVFRPKPDYHSE
jgi:hypothetical protein